MAEQRHRAYCRRWKFLIWFFRPFLKGKFNLKSEKAETDGPCIVISNHVTDWDPLLLAQSFPKNQMYFVASEHIFRKGFLSRLIVFLVGIIPRRKGSMGTDTVMSCLRHLRSGHSVVLFAEGEASWDGLTHDIVTSTGKLVRNSGAALITYKIENAYLSRPRWSKKVYKGRVSCHPVKLYSPEELKTMTPAAIDAQIKSDIYENAWERQHRDKVVYQNDGIADNIELALFMCPKCRNLGTIHGSGKTVSCSICGYSTSFNEYGFFSPAEPFENVHQWDRWQNESFVPDAETTDAIFSDSGFVLKEVNNDHTELVVDSGELELYRDRLSINQHSFPIAEITGLALVQKNLILFSCGGKYYELSSSGIKCLRKYLSAYEKLKNQQTAN